jgi:hypothetical protein
MLFLPILLTTISLVSGHGIVISPPSRTPGPASLSACGKEITNIIEADNQTSIGSLQIASVSSSSFNPKKCNLLVCKGLQLDDNKDNMQVWTPGEKVKLEVWTRIPHAGWASAAIVDTASMLIVGEQLGTWETGSVSGYEAHDLGDDSIGGNGDGEVRGEMQVDLEFEVTIPKVYPRCAVAGECVSIPLDLCGNRGCGKEHLLILG